MDIAQRHRQIKRVTHAGIQVNLGLSLAQIVAGWLANSQALIADGLHTLSDLLSDFVVLFAAKHASQAADPEHPYGHGRFETLSSIFLGLLLVGVGVSIGIEGVHAIFAPESRSIEPFALLFALLAIVSKEFLYRYTLRVSKKINSSLLEANAMHHRSDVLSSIVVMIGIGAQLIGVEHMDALASVVVAIMIGSMGGHLLHEAFSELVDSSLDQELVNAIRQHILATDGIFAIHSLRTRSMGGQGLVDTEIRVNPRLSVSEAHHISLALEHSIRGTFPQISTVSVHIDPVDDEEHATIGQLPNRAEVLFNLYSAWETIKHSDRISNIRLHYLGSTIEIEILLPLEFARQDQSHLGRELRAAALRVPRIGKVVLHYIDP